MGERGTNFQALNTAEQAIILKLGFLKLLYWCHLYLMKWWIIWITDTCSALRTLETCKIWSNHLSCELVISSRQSSITCVLRKYFSCASFHPFGAETNLLNATPYCNCPSYLYFLYFGVLVLQLSTQFTYWQKSWDSPLYIVSSFCDRYRRADVNLSALENMYLIQNLIHPKKTYRVDKTCFPYLIQN